VGISRVVLDTNVLVSALLSRESNPAEIYRMFMAKAFTLVYCAEILNEYGDVLYRPKLRIPRSDADIMLAAIRKHGEEVRTAPSVILMPDEDDRVFYDAAKRSGAYLVTGNKRHYPNEPFIFTPAEFLVLRRSQP